MCEAHSFRNGPWFDAISGERPRGRHGRHRGPGGYGGFRGFPGGGPRARRGDVRAALLALLGEEPRNGYQLMQEIEQRSDGVWRPSPGSVYPALQQLEDEGLVRPIEVEGRKAYEITDEGRAHVEANPEQHDAPWDAVKGDVSSGSRELMQLVRQLAMAAAQLVQAGNDSQITEAQELLTETRRSLYRILAGDPK